MPFIKYTHTHTHTERERERERSENRRTILQCEKEISVAKENVSQELIEVSENLAELKGKNEEMIIERQEGKHNNEKLKDFNQHLIEKEKILKYELTKSRAQSLGLEKICEDFKIQIEEMQDSPQEA